MIISSLLFLLGRTGCVSAASFQGRPAGKGVVWKGWGGVWLSAVDAEQVTEVLVLPCCRLPAPPGVEEDGRQGAAGGSAALGK